ncbi:hypothetical protein ACSQ67_016091 [Phaseolus vulgaris]
MSFGGFLEAKQSGGGGRIVSDIPYSNGSNHSNDIMPSGAISQPRLATPTLAKSMFNSPGLSLALQSDVDGQGDMNRLMPENFEQNGLRRSREEEHESRSGSDNMDGASGDDFDAADNPPRKKRYHRHTPQQIQELEAYDDISLKTQSFFKVLVEFIFCFFGGVVLIFCLCFLGFRLFKECPHPDEKQRLELSRRLNLETRQVKFWFQNRRTQMKTQLERHENSLLRQENDKLRAENMSMREAMRNPMCSNCGGPAMIGEISLEEQHLRIENARLKDELDRVCALAGKFLGRPISSLTNSIGPPLPNSSLELGVGSNGFGGLSTVPSTLPDFGVGISSPLAMMSPSTRPTATSTVVTPGLDRSVERSIVLELALAAMDELVKMAQTGEPLWIRSLEGEEKFSTMRSTQGQ